MHRLIVGRRISVFCAWRNGTGTFATATTTNQSFTPATSNDWCMGPVGSDCYSINLNAFIGQQVLIKIEGYNSGTVGNNLFVDNINIQGVPTNDPPTASFNSSNSTICVGGNSKLHRPVYLKYYCLELEFSWRKS
jgi:hypothetical protein